MIGRIDLIVAVVTIVAAMVASHTALWHAMGDKADKTDLARLDTRIDKLDARIDKLDAKVDAKFDKLEAKLDAVILRLLPESPRA